jgi:predicted NAD/FAD-binding protein
MESSVPARVLIVEHKAPVTPALLGAVSERARRGACSFTLLIPNPAHGLHRVVDPQDQSAGPAQSALNDASQALREAAMGMPVEGIVGDPDPVAAVEDAINLRGFDEIIVSTHSPRLSRWLRLDLPSKIAGMGLPVTKVEPSGPAGLREPGMSRAA